jgi:hypothetical protein
MPHELACTNVLLRQGVYCGFGCRNGRGVLFPQHPCI